MNDVERRAASEQVSVKTPGGLEVRLVEVSEELLGAAYRVIANGTLWPLVHGLFDTTYRPALDRRWHEAWAGYRAYNVVFAEEIARVADEGATVVVNDYHLALCGVRLAKARPDLRTIYFSHTPFCGPDELEILPSEIRKEFLQGLCSFGTTAFHTRHWAGAFEQCVAETLRTETGLAVIPLGVDAEELRRIADSDGVERSRGALAGLVDGRRLIFRSDRVDPAKNIVRGFSRSKPSSKRMRRSSRRSSFRHAFIHRERSSRNTSPTATQSSRCVHASTSVSRRHGASRSTSRSPTTSMPRSPR